MSAGSLVLHATEPRVVVISSIERLAPLLQLSMRAALAEMNEGAGLEAVLHETERSHATALTYYKRGRPPTKEYPRPVTNALNETYTWHGYRLAGDIIHRRLGWDAGDAWFAKMASIAKRYDMKAGINWTHPDPPHVQWAKCKASPSDEARRLLHEHGVVRVWLAVGAIAPADYDTLTRPRTESRTESTTETESRRIA